MIAKSSHQQYVEAFMLKAGVPVPDKPTNAVDEVIRRRCARLILEEAMEAIQELGFVYKNGELLSTHNIVNLAALAKELADSRYVATYAFSCFGLKDVPFQRIVDQNNLMKFGPGHRFREDGKLLPPPGFVKADCKEQLAEQMS